jgi:hypothetical protein
VCRPYRFGVVDADRAIVKFSAKHRSYTELIVKQSNAAHGVSAR